MKARFQLHHAPSSLRLRRRHLQWPPRPNEAGTAVYKSPTNATEALNARLHRAVRPNSNPN
jgi:hypothetical protein